MFKQSVLNTTKTWNGATSYSTTNSALVDFFFAAARGLDENKLQLLIGNAWKEDPLLTLKIIAYIRDIRGGKGERELGRQCLNWLADYHPESLRKNLDLFIKEYGRYDDIVALLLTPCEEDGIRLLTDQLTKDRWSLINCVGPISLAAKWVPSENKKIDKEHNFIDSLCHEMGISRKVLRKEYLSPLRKHLNILETKMCKGEWSDIEFSKVPSCAMNIHGKPKKAFERHQQERFNEYKESLKKGETKINASVLYPHEIVKTYYNDPGYSKEDSIVEAQWNEMIKKGDLIGDLSNVLVMSDVSSSMTCNNNVPMLVSISLGILISSLANEAWRNLVLTFSHNPQFVHLKGNSLYDKVKQLRRAPWGGNTDFQRALELVLQTGINGNLKNEDMPKKLIIISDMQFDQADHRFSSNYTALKQKYQSAGYQVPHLVFWNVNGSITDFPSTNVPGVSLISGFSIECLKCVLQDKEITPYSTMLSAIEVERYSKIIV